MVLPCVKHLQMLTDFRLCPEQEVCVMAATVRVCKEGETFLFCTKQMFRSQMSVPPRRPCRFTHEEKI